MRLSALEIKKKEFQQKMRGCDPDEVQSFLDQVSQEVEVLVREKKDADERLVTTEERLAHYLSLEQTIEKTLMAAQQTAVKIEEQAKREAELIRRDAELDRDRKLTDGRIEVERLERELIRLRAEYDSTLARMRSLLAGFTAFLGNLENQIEHPVTTMPVATAPTSDVSWGA